MKILVTGSAGQVGSHVVDKLISRGDVVCGVDNFETGRRVHVNEHPNYQFFEESISNKDAMHQIFDRFLPEVVVHTAASYKDPTNWHEDISTNILGMANLIELAKLFSSNRFIYFQTALIYGVKPDTNPVMLDHPKRVDNSSYAISKSAAEDYLQLSGLDHVIFRLANVIGDRCVSGPLPIFYQRLMDGKKCFVTSAKRDFIFVDDLVEVVVKAVDGLGKGVYHFSSGSEVPIIDLYHSVAKQLGINEIPEPEFRELSEDDAATITLDPTRTIQDYGHLSFTQLDDIVKAAVDYYNKYGVTGGYTHVQRTHE